MSQAFPPNQQPAPGAPPARTKPVNWVLLVIGVLLAMLGIGLTIGGTALAGADAAQRDGRYLSGPAERYQSTGYALTAPSLVIDPGQAGLPGAPPLSELASILVQVSSAVPGQDIFVGIGEASAVSAYLDGVPHDSLGGFSWSKDGERPGTFSGTPGETEPSAGDRGPAAPEGQDFWAVSASGTGTQEITWDLQPGRWSLVVMNADASRPVWAEIQAGARSELLGPAGQAVLTAGIIGLVLGVPLLLFGAARLGRDIDPAARRRGAAPEPAAGPAPAETARGYSGYPVRFNGFLDPQLSRGLWLVKWLLAIPHFIILALLWFALLVTTVAAGVMILFTARYPRSWFAFCAGVLRWNWRVGFYSYSALGTDRYPPFSLAPAAGYPADLDIAYPERLSRGLVLVKWWLLAIPHLIVIGILTGGAGTLWNGNDSTGIDSTDAGWGPSLLGILVLVAAVVLLFTGRYRTDLFALVIGLNRWVYRVGAYVLLMRDEYPPFRLDQGPADPAPETLPPVVPDTSPQASSGRQV